LHIKGEYWKGTETTTGAIFEAWIEFLRLDQTSGEGTFRCIWVLTYPSLSSIAGTARGEIRGNQIFGTFVGRHGSNEFEGAKRLGSFDGVIQSPTHVIIEVTGVTIYH